MSNTQAGRIFAEAIAIVGGILLAFSIDAWWDERKTENDVRESLEAVRDEIAANLTSLRDSIESHRDISLAIEQAQANESWYGLVPEAVIAVEVYEPTSSALDMIMATGRLSEIDSTPLRISLSALPKLSEDLREHEGRAVEFRDLARQKLAAQGFHIWKGIPKDAHLPDQTEVLNLLTMRGAEERLAEQAAIRLAEQMTSTLALLNEVH